MTPKMTEAESDKARKEAKRIALRDLRIPIPANPSRRLEAEADPRKWLDTYFADIFSETWTEDREAMLKSIIDAALYGGDQAIAGPRGEGKTTIATYAALYLMVTGLSTFPVVIGKSQGKSQLELKAVRDKLQQQDIFIADYPEIGVPMKAVGGWSSRARMQTVSGKETNIELAADHIAFPTIEQWQLPSDWPKKIKSAATGQVIFCLGVDGPVRGTKFRSARPTLAIIDDIEDREAAASETLIAKNEEILEQDVAGLGASAERIPRVMLCTTQNRRCIAYRYTDPKQKPSWRGRRYRKMVKRPDRMDLVATYIEARQNRSTDDPDAREAFRFWRDNREELERGAVVSNPFSYSKKVHEDGEPMELSAVHSYFNRVADVGEKAVATEIDNDPPEETGSQGNGLTAQRVQTRIGKYNRREYPLTTQERTVAIDIGDRTSHWVDIGWEGKAIGSVVDYGVMETWFEFGADEKAIELAILSSLEIWADDVVSRIKPIIAFVDSGSGKQKEAVYEFCRRRGRPFFPSKGWDDKRFRLPEKSNGKEPFLESWAHWKPEDRVWLYNVNTEWWKKWVHRAFTTSPFDDKGNRNDGTLTLFDPGDSKRTHNSFAHHIVAEEEKLVEVNGKEKKSVWWVKNHNNHWLDATALACAGAGAVGIRLVQHEQLSVQPKTGKTQSGFTNQFGQPFLATQR
jgi:hypothetical protein